MAVYFYGRRRPGVEVIQFNGRRAGGMGLISTGAQPLSSPLKTGKAWAMALARRNFQITLISLHSATLWAAKYAASAMNSVPHRKASGCGRVRLLAGSALVGDCGREIVWWLARRHCGLTLGQLGEKAGAVDYAAVGMALSRFESKMRLNSDLRRDATLIEEQMLNVEI